MAAETEIKVGDFVKTKSPQNRYAGRVLRVIDKVYHPARPSDGVRAHTVIYASPLSNWPMDGIQMLPSGFVKVDPPEGWENFTPVQEDGGHGAML